ncbi:MAG: restriction endonuclease subunit S, partial [Bacteroidales bacterium]|nr:restriction endonuclease subunit S [Bacteroidales bacterium]
MKKGWEYCQLEDAVEKGSSNISLNKIKDDDGKYPVFSAQGFAQNVSFYHRDKEYLAIIKDGAGIGRVSKHPAKSSVVATMQYLIPKKSFDIDFIKYFLEGIDFEKHRNGSTIPHIYFKDYKSEKFPKLPLAEQQRIVSILDQCFSAIDQAKANAEQNLKNAKELFENYLQKAFENENWKVKKLGELATFRNGMNFTKSSRGQKIKIVGVKDFQDNFSVPFDELESVVLDGKLSEIDELKEN